MKKNNAAGRKEMADMYAQQIKGLEDQVSMLWNVFLYH